MGISSGTKEESKKLEDEFMAKLTLNMAMSELEANRGQKALILATNVIKREPQNPLGYFRKGVICDRLEEFEFALYLFWFLTIRMNIEKALERSKSDQDLTIKILERKDLILKRKKKYDSKGKKQFSQVFAKGLYVRMR